MPPPRRDVVVTGMGLLCPIGHDPESAFAALREGKSGVRLVPEWQGVDGLGAHLAALVDGIDLEAQIERRLRRSMGRVAQLALVATRQAVAAATLSPDELADLGTGLYLGSTTGSPAATLDWYRNVLGPGSRANKATAFLQVMSHTCAANVALALGIRGRVVAPNSACTSSSQALGLAYEAVAFGRHDLALAGGAEEAHYTTAATFDLAGAASRAFDAEPTAAPRPFDSRRDGMVVGEGAAVLVLESRERAVRRGAPILARVLGFATGADASHMTSPSADGMEVCMRAALADAGLAAEQIDYVNAHATGTELGDAAEAEATARVFGDRVPVSSTKGHVGHTLGACGALESIFAIQMMRHGVVIPTRNLDAVDPRCAGLLLPRRPEARSLERVMNNNFAFGGINTSLVFATGG